MNNDKLTVSKKSNKQSVGFSKDKYKSLPYDTIEKEKEYALTINPEKQQHNKGGPRWIHIAQDIKSILDWHNGYTYFLKLDISKLGRIHFHGVIKFKDEYGMFDWYNDIIPKLMTVCTFEMDTIQDDKVWSDYCYKSIKNLPEEIGKYSLTNIKDKNGI